MKKILVTYPIPYEGLISLEQSFEIVYPEDKYLTKEDIISNIGDCDALLSIFSMPVDRDIIKAGKNLKLISNYGVGYNNIDIETAKQCGIVVCNTPEAVCRPTAELTLGLILSLSRRISECNYRLRTESDFKWGVMENLGLGLYGKTLGIVGMGKIGMAVAKLAQAFGMKIVYTKRNRLSKCEEERMSIVYCSFEELLRSSDIISLHTPLNKETHHLIGHNEFSMMKPTALLINTARGAVINEDDLVDVLRNDGIAGAALDVFENEPHIHPDLFSLNNVVIVPHIGTASIDSRIEMGKEAGDNIINFFNESPTNIVS
jgi:glyoxylate reductase